MAGLQPVIHCGRHALELFCLGLVLSLLGTVALDVIGRGWFSVLTVNTAGILLLIGAARIMTWYQQARYRPTAIPGRHSA
ncbi:OpgC domain-containing protein, partial [Acinetobacter baumannii]